MTIKEWTHAKRLQSSHDMYNKHPALWHICTLDETWFCTTYVRYCVLISITTSFRICHIHCKGRSFSFLISLRSQQAFSEVSRMMRQRAVLSRKKKSSEGKHPEANTVREKRRSRGTYIDSSIHQHTLIVNSDYLLELLRFLGNPTFARSTNYLWSFL